MRSKYPLIYTVALVTIAALLAVVTGGPTGTALSPATATAANTLALPVLEGTWSGAWTDTVFNVSGAMTFVIWSEGADYAANGTIDVTNIGFGLGVLNGSATAFDNGVSLDIDFEATSLGSGSAVLTPVKSGSGPPVATASGSGNVGGVMNFGPFTLAGTASDLEITGSFAFIDGGKGTMTMTKTSVAVEPTTWGNLKATYTEH